MAAGGIDKGPHAGDLLPAVATAPVYKVRADEKGDRRNARPFAVLLYPLRAVGVPLPGILPSALDKLDAVKALSGCMVDTAVYSELFIPEIASVAVSAHAYFHNIPPLFTIMGRFCIF